MIPIWQRAVIALLVASHCGCTGYSDVSRAAYEHAKALYAICNRQDEARLGAIDQQIKEAAAEGQLSVQEAAWLQQIVGDARQGAWGDAQQACRDLMEAQAEW
jgi:hypothetical protein